MENRVALTAEQSREGRSSTAAPDRHGRELPARDCIAHVGCGDGAVMSIVNPWSDDHLEWGLRYGNPTRMRYVAASVIESYDYLLSDQIPMKEAVRRLRLLRKKRVDLRKAVEERSHP